MEHPPTLGLAILRQAPTARSASRRRLGPLAEAMKPGGRRAVGVAKARRIQELARQTIAPPELDEQMAFEVHLLIEQYDLLGKQIEMAEKRVAELLDSELARRLQTIPGVGPATVATLLAEIGDIWRFDDFDQLPAYAGTDPKDQSSGRHGANPETSWRMAQHNPIIQGALPPQAPAGQGSHERAWPLHVQGSGHRLGRLALRSGLRPHQGRPDNWTRPYGI